MELPEIYESDYLNAVHKAHTIQWSVQNPICSISCRTTRCYESLIQEDYKETPSKDYVTLFFHCYPPSITTGLRRWSLKTKIILVPDNPLMYKP